MCNKRKIQANKEKKRKKCIFFAFFLWKNLDISKKVRTFAMSFEKQELLTQ